MQDLHPPSGKASVSAAAFARVKRPAIICLGHAALDRIYTIAQFPANPQKLRAVSAEEVGGGMAANASVAAARLGADVAFCSRVGEDLAGEAICTELAREGVDVSQVRRFAGGQSSTSAVIVDGSGERLLVNHRGAGLSDDASWLDVSGVSQARAVLADVRWPQGALKLFRAARDAYVPTILDGDIGAGEALPDLLAFADYVVFSAPGLAEFSPGDKAEALAEVVRLGARHAGVTQGGDGYLWLDHAGKYYQPAFDVNVVDTSGAGDAFHGGFALGVAQGLPDEDCVRIAQATAALKCLQPGNRRGLPDLMTLEAFLAGRSVAST